MAQAESVRVAAQAELQRTRDLVAQGFLSEARLDEVRRAAAVAQAQLDAANAQRAANAEPGTDVAQAQAQLALASAARAAAEAIAGARYVEIPSPEGHMAASFRRPRDVAFIDRTMQAFFSAPR